MQINTKFNVGDIVYYRTQELIDDDGVCECCGRKNQGHFGPVIAEDAIVLGLKVLHDDMFGVIDISYYLSTSGDYWSENGLYATEEEALASGGKND
jgi:hypothetical protein